MTVVKPPRPRYSMTEEPSGFEVVIPARKHLLLLVFLAFWLVGWGVGEMVLFHRLRVIGAPEPFVFAWLGAWTIGGLWVLYLWLWMLVGKERVRLQSNSLQIRKEILFYARNREFEVAHIRRLRVAPIEFRPAARLRLLGLGGGLLAFDYGARTFRFGAGLDEAEAREVAGALLARNPALGRST